MDEPECIELVAQIQRAYDRLNSTLVPRPNRQTMWRMAADIIMSHELWTAQRSHMQSDSHILRKLREAQ